MIRLVLILATICAPCSMALAQAPKSKMSEDRTIEQIVLQLEKEGREATLKNDIAATDRLLAQNWLNVNPDGSVTNKAQLMELLRAGSFKIHSIENDEVLVRTFGETVVVTGRSTTQRGGQGSELLKRQVRFTRIYAKPLGQWRVVSAHNTLIQ